MQPYGILQDTEELSGTEGTVCLKRKENNTNAPENFFLFDTPTIVSHIFYSVSS
jgi:hypothetical protein